MNLMLDPGYKNNQIYKINNYNVSRGLSSIIKTIL